MAQRRCPEIVPLLPGLCERIGSAEIVSTCRPSCSLSKHRHQYLSGMPDIEPPTKFDDRRNVSNVAIPYAYSEPLPRMSLLHGY